MDVPILYVIAGPNGIGKTTSDFDLVPGNIPVINSDEIAAEIKRSGQSNINTQEIANGKATELMEGYLNQRSSLGFETNLCDVETWKFLLGIQTLGYQLHVIYISTSDLDVLNSRIETRVKLGGHFVLPEIVRERYLAGLNLLNYYFDKPDRLQLFDNSVTMELIAEISKGEVLHTALKLPDWIFQYLGKRFTKEVITEIKPRDLNSIEEVRKRYLENRRKTGENKLSEDPPSSHEKGQEHRR